MASPIFGSTGLQSGVSPLVILGNRLTGQGSDSTLQGFSKFNNHDHWRGNPADFRFYGLAVADEAYIYDETGENIIGDALPATIDFISGDTLRLTVSATKDVINGTLVARYDRTVIVPGINITAGTNTVSWYKLPGETRPGIPGFTTPAISAASLSWVIQGSLVNPTSGVYRIMSLLPEPSWLVAAGLQTEGEVNPHCDAQFIVNTSGSDVDYGEPSTVTDRPSFITFVPESASTQITYPATYARSYLPEVTSVGLRVFNVNPDISRSYASNTLTYTLRFHKVIPE